MTYTQQSPQERFLDGSASQALSLPLHSKAHRRTPLGSDCVTVPFRQISTYPNTQSAVYGRQSSPRSGCLQERRWPSGWCTAAAASHTGTWPSGSCWWPRGGWWETLAPAQAEKEREHNLPFRDSERAETNLVQMNRRSVGSIPWSLYQT